MPVDLFGVQEFVAVIENGDGVRIHESLPKTARSAVSAASRYAKTCNIAIDTQSTVIQTALAFSQETTLSEYESRIRRVEGDA